MTTKKIILEGTVKYPIEKTEKIMKEGIRSMWKTHIRNNETQMHIAITTKNRLDVAPGEDLKILLVQEQTTIKDHGGE